MSDSIASNLLKSIPRGEAILDSRVGSYIDVEVGASELVQNSTGSWAIVTTFNSMTDSNGRIFEHKERYNIPTSDSNNVVKSIFLGVLHDLGLETTKDDRPFHVDTEETRALVAEAFNTKQGATVNLKLSEDKSGYLHAKILRSKRG